MGPGGGETEQDPMWLLGTAAFPRPWFPVCRERTPPSTSFPESHREDSRGGWSGKGVDAETREDQPGKSSSASGQVWSASRDTHDRSFELFMEQKPPTSGRCQRSLFRGRLVLMLSHQVESSSLQPVVHRAPLSMGFPRQEYCRGLPFPPPGDLPNSGTKPTSPALAGRFVTAEQPGKQGRPSEAR